MTLFPLLESKLLNIGILLNELGRLHILQGVLIHHSIRILLNNEQGLIIIAVTIIFILLITILCIFLSFSSSFVRSAHFTVQNVVIHSCILNEILLLSLMVLELEEKLLGVCSAMGSISRLHSILYLVPIFAVYSQRLKEPFVLLVGPLSLIILLLFLLLKFLRIISHNF